MLAPPALRVFIAQFVVECISGNLIDLNSQYLEIDHLRISLTWARTTAVTHERRSTKRGIAGERLPIP